MSTEESRAKHLKAQRDKYAAKALAHTPLPRLPKPKHKMDPIKLGRPQAPAMKTRVKDESKMVKLYIPERRMEVLYDPTVKSEQEVREKYSRGA